MGAEEEIHFDHGLFGERVAGNDVLLRRRAHHVGLVIGQSGRHPQQRGLAGGQIVMHAGLDQRAGVVEIVLRVIVAAVETPAMFGLVKLGAGVEVAVGIFGLGGGDMLDVAVDPLFELRIRLGRQEIGHAADGFVEQAVVPRAGLVAAGEAVADAIEVLGGSVSSPAWPARRGWSPPARFCAWATRTRRRSRLVARGRGSTGGASSRGIDRRFLPPPAVVRRLRKRRKRTTGSGRISQPVAWQFSLSDAKPRSPAVGYGSHFEMVVGGAGQGSEGRGPESDRARRQCWISYYGESPEAIVPREEQRIVPV